jgi:hypothetical protein
LLAQVAADPNLHCSSVVVGHLGSSCRCLIHE